MDSYNSFSNGASVYEELSPCPPSIVQSNYASVYQVNYKGELQFVYVQYSQQYPSFDELIAAIKVQCKISDEYKIEISNENKCKIATEIVFGHFIRYVYNSNTIFVVETKESVEASSSESARPAETVEELPLIYENPDKFFIHFLSKDLINYFRHQTRIICSPNGIQLIEKYNVLKDPNLVEAEKKTIIQISADHLMVIKNNEPSIHDRTLWAKVICEVFPQFRDTDSNVTENYLAVFNPTKGDGFLGNRIKLIKRLEKDYKDNKKKIEQLNAVASVSNVDLLTEINQTEIEPLVEFMKTCDKSKDLALVKEYHKKTFILRQHYRQSKQIKKLIADFPRMLDVDGLIDEDFATLYPLSGLITFTQEVQQKILKAAKGSKNYIKFPSSHKNLAEPIDALLHLILLLPPTSMGRGCKNRVKIEDAFPRLVRLHEVNQPILNVIQSRDETPFIIVSGSLENCVKIYYVAFDNNIIRCESPTRAIDILLKVHYVFDFNFDSNIRHVLGFIGYYCYHIRNLEPTSQMRILNTQIFK